MKILFINFNNFCQFFGIFDSYLLQKKPIASAYDRSCQPFFSFNLPQIGCFTTVSSFISIGLVFLEIRRGSQVDPHTLNKTTFRKLSLIRVSIVLICTLREKRPYSKFFQSAFSRICTEYGEIFISVRVQFECGKMQTRKTPNMDTFHALVSKERLWCSYFSKKYFKTGFFRRTDELLFLKLWFYFYYYYIIF